MKGAIFSLGSKSSKWVEEEMKNYFTQVHHYNLKHFNIKVNDKGVEVLYNNETIPHYDVVYMRGSYKYALLLRILSSVIDNSYLPIKSDAFEIVHDKILTQSFLAKNNIPTPLTYIASSTTTAKETLKKMNYPVIIKLPRGTQGKGVMFAESFASASSTLDALDSMNKVYLLQEYIETGGKDLRVLVVGNQIVGTMQREAQKDEKRANIHAGGCGVSKRITPEIEDICLKTAKILGTEIVGIDILEGRKPYVIEANLSPGLQGITAVTKINIAQKIAKYLYEKGCSFKEKYTNESVSNMIDEISLNKHIENVIVSNLTMRGKKIILPDFVTNITKFNDSKEVTFKIAKGKVEISEK